MRPALALLALLPLGGCWSPDPAPPTQAPEDAPDAAAPALPDLVVVTLDTTRADHLGLYGYFRDTSPALDALGRESLVFERLVVPMATTLPTHTSLFTATWPEEHGVLANVQHGGRRFVASEALTPFAAWAASVGYRTAAFTSAAPLSPSSGIQAGFHTFDAPQGAERRGADTVDAALAWLAGPHDGPVLLWVHLYDPHNPYHPDPAHLERYRATGADVEPFLEARKVARVTRRPSGEVVKARPVANEYDAEIRTMDDALARLFQALRERPAWERTAMVVMGDHGESLNQHGEPGHGLVWGEQLHAPLLLRAPGLAPGRADVVLSAADVLPTLLGRVELPEEDRFLSQASGTDVLAAGFAERAVLSQASDRQVSLGKERVYALTSRGLKCVGTEGGEVESYDLTTDPFELAPRRGTEVEAACAAALREAVAAQKARGEKLGAGKTVEADPAEVELLKGLGYLDDEAPDAP